MGTLPCTTPKAKSHLVALALGRRRMRKGLWRSRESRKLLPALGSLPRNVCWKMWTLLPGSGARDRDGVGSSQLWLRSGMGGKQGMGRCWAHPSSCAGLGWMGCGEWGGAGLIQCSPSAPCQSGQIRVPFGPFFPLSGQCRYSHQEPPCPPSLWCPPRAPGHGTVPPSRATSPRNPLGTGLFSRSLLG